MKHMNTVSGQNAELLGAHATWRCAYSDLSLGSSVHTHETTKKLLDGSSVNLILEIITINYQATY
jgi:hypothetical protein